MSGPLEQETLREEEPRWGRAYGLILGFFALEILLLYVFTARFS